MENLSLWQYSLDTYAVAGVEPLLVELQDHQGMDITLILACCWLASRRQLLTETLFRETIKRVQPWSRECITPLRAVRRYVKTTGSHERFREQLKALELEAERVQLQQLEALLAGCPAAPDAIPFDGLLQENLVIYSRASALFEWADVADQLLSLVGLLKSQVSGQSRPDT